jgi:hypothetical protein
MSQLTPDDIVTDINQNGVKTDRKQFIKTDINQNGVNTNTRVKTDRKHALVGDPLQLHKAEFDAWRKVNPYIKYKKEINAWRNLNGKKKKLRVKKELGLNGVGSGIPLAHTIIDNAAYRDRDGRQYAPVTGSELAARVSYSVPDNAKWYFLTISNKALGLPVVNEWYTLHSIDDDTAVIRVLILFAENKKRYVHSRITGWVAFVKDSDL